MYSIKAENSDKSDVKRTKVYLFLQWLLHIVFPDFLTFTLLTTDYLWLSSYINDFSFKNYTSLKE